MKIDPHQRVAVDRLRNGNILAGGTGVGKSRTVMAYFIEKVCGGTLGEQGDMKTPRDMIVLTTAKKRDSHDWEHEAVQFKFGKDRSLSQDGIRIVVDSWNNIEKYKSIQNAFFVFDEQRVVGSGKWSNAFIKIAKRNQWILLSATPGDTWLDYVPVFIANGFYKNRTEFKETHVIYNAYAKYPKVDRYVSVARLVKYRNQILVPMPYPRHTVRHPHDIEVDFDVELERRVREDRWHVYEEQPLRDVAELFSVMRKVVNSDRSRLRAVSDLLEKHPKLIVFYNFDYELEILRSLVPEGQMASPESIRELKEKLDSRELQPFSAQTGSRKTPTSTATPLPSSSTARLSSGTTTSSTILDQEGLSLGESLHQSTTDLFGPGISDSISPTGTLSATVTKEESEWESPGTSETDQLSGTKPKKLSYQSTPPWSLTPNPTSGETSAVSKVLDSSLESPSTTTSGGQQERSSTPSSESRTLPQSSERKTSSLGRSTSTVEKIQTTSAGVMTKTDLVDSASTRNVPFTLAEWNGHKHEEIPKTDSWVYLVQYAAGAEGWNCIETDAICFYSLPYSFKMFDQAHGRIDRMNTPFRDLHFYYLMSYAFIDEAISKALAGKRSFTESSLKLGSSL